MRRIHWAAGAVVALGLWACGGSSARTGAGADASMPREATRSAQVPGGQAAQLEHVQLRLLGVHGSYGSVLTSLDRVELEANGHPLPVEVEGTTLDLANGAQAWLIGTFDVPKGVDRVTVRVYLDEAGGFATAGEEGEVDQRGASLEAELDVAHLALRNHAVFQLDVDRSLVEDRPEHRVFLPQWTLAY
jgi:hypothetical protein